MPSKKFLKPVALLAAALAPLAGASLPNDDVVISSDIAIVEEAGAHYLAEDFVLRPSDASSDQIAAHASHSSHSSHASHQSHSSHSSSGY
jgi:CMP-N-acetylneuraminic acid synthetase